MANFLKLDFLKLDWLALVGLRRRRSLASAIVLGLSLALSLGPSLGLPARADFGTDSRIARLEADLSRLQRRVARLESARSPDRAAPPAASPGGSPPAAAPSDDPMFDRLATLAIELKDDLRAIEARLAVLEARLGIDAPEPERIPAR